MIENLVRKLLAALGENPSREGLKGTPLRVRRSLEFLTKGYRDDPGKILRGAIFNEKSNNMVIVKDIEFYSLCEHHMLPFFGKCYVGYISEGRVYGVSKLARVVECFSRRLQIQERLTQEIADTLMTTIRAEGVGVVMEARHLCMMMRGVEKQNSVMVTSAMLGSFRDDPKTREEFLDLIRQNGPAH